ncbi:MAG: hypothetical protein ACTSX2_04440, partial [Candidatus Thorarchaeota archaeon]
MKTKHSPGYGDDDYNVIPLGRFPFVTLAAGATQLRIRKKRLTRLLRILKIPIYKVGTLVLIEPKSI